MMMDKLFFAVMLASLVCLGSCGGAEEEVSQIEILSATINGNAVTQSDLEIAASSELILTFDKAVDQQALEEAISVTDGAGVDYTANVALSSGNSRATISLQLDPEKDYDFFISRQPIGREGEQLSVPFQFSFRTNNQVQTDPPCLSASEDCNYEVVFESSGSTESFNFYSNYDPVRPNPNVQTIMIVVHGINRNAGEYFNWVNRAVANANQQGGMLVIAPRFKVESEAASDELYWGRLAWRDGDNSSSSVKVSSFAVVDSIINEVVSSGNFEGLQQVVVTGHSSGGLFTHVYAASNGAENTYDELRFRYVPSNSQYYYYPTDQRWDESTDDLFVPANCNSYDIWPLGFNVVPAYLSNISEEVFNTRFIEREIIYLLGNGQQADPTLNVSDCNAVLLGTSRYRRGENILRTIEQLFPQNNHREVTVEGVGHDGEGMYSSSEFQSLLSSLTPS